MVNLVCSSNFFFGSCVEDIKRRVYSRIFFFLRVVVLTVGIICNLIVDGVLS